MSIKFTCDDKQTLVSYLYGEVDHETRQAVDAHLNACAACAAEVIALGDARSGLGMWVPPDVELDFKIVKKSELPPANVLRPERWWKTVPAWAQAAAAIFVLASAAAIANVQVTSGPEGFSVSTGWMQRGAVTAPMSASPNDEAWRAALVSLEQQLRSEIRSTREQETRLAARTPVDEATIRRVQQLIAASEQRHEQALAMRFVEFTRDMNMQRRADLMKISQGFDDYNGQLLRQRQMMNNMIRVSTTPQQ
jgi:anti-sigma factor RsiW